MFFIRILAFLFLASLQSKGAVSGFEKVTSAQILYIKQSIYKALYIKQSHCILPSVEKNPSHRFEILHKKALHSLRSASPCKENFF